MRTIAVHAGALTHSAPCGIGYYVLHLLKTLLATDPVNRYVLLSGRPLQHAFEGASIRTCSPKLAFSYLGFPRGVRQARADVALIPKECTSPLLRQPTIAIAYDLYYRFAPKSVLGEVPLSTKLFYKLAASYSLRRADRILAISQNTKRELIECAGVDPSRVLVAPPGCDLQHFRPYSPSEIARILEKYNIQGPYFINVSSRWYARKNLVRLAAAFDRHLSKTFSLVITGTRGPAYPQLLSMGKKLILLEHVPREDLPLLLAGARALVFPSLHEGFGMPVVEAMACGCPVITSNSSALPEVAGEAALLVDPLSTGAIEEAMLLLAENDTLCKQLKEKGLTRAQTFTWERTATTTLEAIQAV